MRLNPCKVRFNIKMNIPARGSIGQMRGLGTGGHSGGCGAQHSAIRGQSGDSGGGAGEHQGVHRARVGARGTQGSEWGHGHVMARVWGGVCGGQSEGRGVGGQSGLHRGQSGAGVHRGQSRRQGVHRSYSRGRGPI